MPMSDRRVWIGGNGCKHILGEVKVIVRDGGYRVRALLVYEVSVLEIPAEIPPVRMRVVGDAFGIRCTICGGLRDWHLGEDALEALIAKRKNRQKKST